MASQDHRIIVLFDGRCGFCSRVIVTLRRLDWLRSLHFVNFHDAPLRTAIAPNIPLEQLNHVMHIKRPDGTFAYGFSAFRTLSWHLPLLWIIAPLFHLPGAKAIGERVYVWVAEHRG